MTNILYQGFFVTVCAGTAYRDIFSKVKKKNICNVYYYRISDFRLVSTGTYYLVPAPIFVQKTLIISTINDCLAVEIESANTGTKLPDQRDEVFESIGALNYDPSFSAVSVSCTSRPPPSHSSFPPTRSAYNLHHHLLTTHIQEDDMDDLPLPPPPEDFDTYP